MKSSRTWFFVLLFSQFCLCACLHPARFAGSAPSSGPAFAEKIELDGVAYVGKVNDFLYRGSQPNERGIEQLKKIGITTIVDLRGERQGTVATEKRRAEKHGIRLVNIHASGWSPPKDEELVQFFSLIRQRPREKLYVHCWLGNDRTGVFIAAYRMAFEHWSAERALEEMNDFRFKGFWHPAMKAYIRKFPAHFAESPAFARFRSASSPKN